MVDESANAGASAPSSDRDKIIDAMMALLAEHGYERINFADLAERAGVPLHRCRAAFDSRIDVLAAHMRRIDGAVLAGGDADMATEPPRERLFDVLMRRIEVLAPYKESVRSLARSARCNPGLAFALNGLSVQSQQWMLTAADISAAGPRGIVRAQGLALLFASVVSTWLDDDDPGHARTMAALDRALARGQHWSGFLDNVLGIPARLCRARPRRRRHDREESAAA